MCLSLYFLTKSIATAKTYLICSAGSLTTNTTQRHAWKDLNGLGLAAIAAIRAKKSRTRKSIQYDIKDKDQVCIKSIMSESQP